MIFLELNILFLFLERRGQRHRTIHVCKNIDKKEENEITQVIKLKQF